MLTGLVVGPDTSDRARTAALVATAGWQVRVATDAREALTVARSTALDLVVTDLEMPGGDGPALLRRLRLTGCRAHLVGTALDVTAEVSRAGTAAGALAVLPAPLDPDALLRFLLGRIDSAEAEAVAMTDDVVDGDAVDGELSDRLQELYAGALPGRLSAIHAGARTGDAPALASASTTLAGSSAQLGHPEMAALCRAIAADARRGVLTHELVDRLLDLATA